VVKSVLMKKTFLLWDFDNTLAYRSGMWGSSLHTVLMRNGFSDITLKDISPYFKSGFPWHRHAEAHSDYFGDQSWWEVLFSIFKTALSGLGIDPSLYLKLCEETRDEYLDISKWNLFDDTIPTLERSLDMGFKNIILSNHTPELSEIVKKLGIDSYFDEIISSANVGYDKPNPKIFEQVYKHKDPENRFIMIGDNPVADVQGALDFGFDAILVRKENKNNYQYYSETLDGIWKHIN
jgi:putative hydrolase of the HAD superfamily